MRVNSCIFKILAFSSFFICLDCGNSNNEKTDVQEYSPYIIKFRNLISIFRDVIKVTNYTIALFKITCIIRLDPVSYEAADSLQTHLIIPDVLLEYAEIVIEAHLTKDNLELDHQYLDAKLCKAILNRVLEYLITKKVEHDLKGFSESVRKSFDTFLGVLYSEAASNHIDYIKKQLKLLPELKAILDFLNTPTPHPDRPSCIIM